MQQLRNIWLPLTLILVLAVVAGQRVAPGVPPQHYVSSVKLKTFSNSKHQYIFFTATSSATSTTAAVSTATGKIRQENT